MHPHAAVLGSDFSNWARLTDQYSDGLEALRRREPGASARMMEIARQLRQYALLVGEAPLPPMSVEPETRRRSVGSTLGRLAMAIPTLPRIRVRRTLSTAALSA
jgi:hypothetical protein